MTTFAWSKYSTSSWSVRNQSISSKTRSSVLWGHPQGFWSPGLQQQLAQQQSIVMRVLLIWQDGDGVKWAPIRSVTTRPVRWSSPTQLIPQVHKVIALVSVESTAGTVFHFSSLLSLFFYVWCCCWEQIGKILFAEKNWLQALQQVVLSLLQSSKSCIVVVNLLVM